MFSIMEASFKPEATGFLCQAEQLGARVRTLKFGCSYKRRTLGRKRLHHHLVLHPTDFPPLSQCCSKPSHSHLLFLMSHLPGRYPPPPVCTNTLTSRSPGNATFFRSPSQTTLLECVPHSHSFPHPWHPSVWTDSTWVPLYSASWTVSTPRTGPHLAQNPGGLPKKGASSHTWKECRYAHPGAISPGLVSAMCHRTYPLEDRGRATGPSRHRVSGQDTRLVIGKHQVIRNQTM